MNENGQPLQIPDLSCYRQNRNNYPLEQLLPYAGLFVAWSSDGTRILASGESLDAVDQELQAAGIHFSQVVHDYIEPPLE